MDRGLYPPQTDKERFFVITAIFNPASFNKRYELYHQFAQHMNETGAQLITIECIFPKLNQHKFQVTNSNNPYHIQLKSESIYWMKENLINIAVSRLPSHAKWICWLDADIYFDEMNWIDQTLEALKYYTVVQLFETSKFLGPNKEVLRIDYSFGYSVVHQKPIDQSKYQDWYPHPGYGWAMMKSTFLQINGLPEYYIVGSGDLHFAFSLIDRVSNTIEKNLNPEYKKMIISQSHEIYTKLESVSRSYSKSIVGYVPLTINHSWHGTRKDRQYVDRWKILIAHNFNYRTDVNKTRDGLLLLAGNNITDEPSEGEGCFLWNCCKNNNGRMNSLQEDIQLHFEMRNEDTNNYKLEDNFLVSQPIKKIKHVRRNSKNNSTLVAGVWIPSPDYDSESQRSNYSSDHCDKYNSFDDCRSHDTDDYHGGQHYSDHHYDSHHNSDHHHGSHNSDHYHGSHHNSDHYQDHYSTSNNYPSYDYNSTIVCTSQY